MTEASDRIRELWADGVHDVHEITAVLLAEGEAAGTLDEGFRQLAPAGIRVELARIQRESTADARASRVERVVVREHGKAKTVRRKVWYERKHPVVLVRVLAAPVGTGHGYKPWAELTEVDLLWRWNDDDHRRVAATLSQEQNEKLRAALAEHDVKRVGDLPSQVLADIFDIPLDETAA